jgi:hypothetical protein
MKKVIKRLDLENFEEIKNLFWRCELARVQRSNTPGKEPIPVEYITATWNVWSEAIKKYYLINDEFHYLYGCWIDDKLVAHLGWRCDLPKPYDNDWVMVYLKGDPDYNIAFEALPDLGKKMFEECEKRGLTRWHSIWYKERYKKFDAWERKFLGDFRKHYEFSTLCEIPAGTRPEIDWIWAMMGRDILKTDQEVRTGTRIK